MLGKTFRVAFVVTSIALIIYAIESICVNHPFIGTGVALFLVTSAIIGAMKDD